MLDSRPVQLTDVMRMDPVAMAYMVLLCCALRSGRPSMRQMTRASAFVNP